MDGLAADHAQSWFLVKVAVAFSPTLTLWAADVIGRFLRGARWPRSEAQSGGNPHGKLAEALGPSRDPTTEAKAG
jgi:hypothetical protein